jgi:dTDP-4-amino-4,6-dideoxygalactose transaminase
MKVRFLDLSIKGDEKESILSRVSKVLDHGMLVNGSEVVEFEDAVAKYCGRKYAVGVNSGTDALYLGLRALGIGVGDEVITTAFSWIATANAIVLTGAKPVFADIDNDLNINIDSIRRLISDKTKAIMPVHYAGKIAKMEEIGKIAKEYGLLVIEDGSQAFGATRKGAVSGSFGDMACFSLNPMKILAACGEAGIVLTDDVTVGDRLEMLRYNGTVNKETCLEAGLNGRLDTLQAAILIERLKNVDNVLGKRRVNAKLYNQLLSGIPEIYLPEDGECQDAYYTYTIQYDKRDELMAYLASFDIETKIYHPILMPMQPAYIDKTKCEIDNAKVVISRILCLPIHEKLNKDDIFFVSDKINEFFRKI